MAVLFYRFLMILLEELRNAFVFSCLAENGDSSVVVAAFLAVAELHGSF